MYIPKHGRINIAVNPACHLLHGSKIKLHYLGEAFDDASTDIIRWFGGGQV